MHIQKSNDTNNLTKQSAKNAIVALLNLLITSFGSLIIVKLLLLKLGSEYNGINSTVTQLLTWISLLEGGVTVASQVALYKPFSSKDTQGVNTILSTTRVIFNKVGVLSLCIGIPISAIYALFVKTEIPYSVVTTIFILSIIATAFSFACISKYRLIFQVAQKQYVVTGVQLIITVVEYIVEVIILYTAPNIIYLRISKTVSTLLLGVIVTLLAKKMYPTINYKADIDRSRIVGANDVFVAKIASLFYVTAPVLFMSTFIGVTSTSVFAVYNSVIVLITNVIYSFVDAPQHALGIVISNGNDESTRNVFNEYEFIIVMMITLMFTVTAILVMPFIRIYTQGVTDADYRQPYIAVLLIATSITQLLHIPSGHCINLYGRFHDARNIQICACILIILFSIIGAVTFGLYGILVAKLLTSVFLMIVEIRYTREKILSFTHGRLLLMCGVNLLFAIVLYAVLFRITDAFVTNYIRFVIAGVVLVLITAILQLLINSLLFKEETKSFMRRIRRAKG